MTRPSLEYGRLLRPAAVPRAPAGPRSFVQAVVLSRALRVRHALFASVRGLSESACSDAGRGPHLPTVWISSLTVPSCSPWALSGCAARPLLEYGRLLRLASVPRAPAGPRSFVQAAVLSRALRVRHALFAEVRGLCESARSDPGRGPHLLTVWSLISFLTVPLCSP